MFLISKKPQILKSNLKVWNKNKFGNVQGQVRKDEQVISKIQEEMDSFGHSNELIVQERVAQNNLDHAINVEETFGKKRP